MTLSFISSGNAIRNSAAAPRFVSGRSPWRLAGPLSSSATSAANSVRKAIFARRFFALKPALKTRIAATSDADNSIYSPPAPFWRSSTTSLVPRLWHEGYRRMKRRGYSQTISRSVTSVPRECAA